MNNKSKYVYIIIAFWFLVVAIWVLQSNYTLNTGKEVLLKTIPVDPRDLFMGDYVILNYEIAQMPEKSPVKYQYGKQVYVTLSTDNNNVAHIKSIKISKPTKDTLYLKGKLKNCPTQIPLLRGGQCIEYGIENYYVKEKTGKKIERNLSEGGLVKVSVDKNGNARIKGFQ